MAVKAKISISGEINVSYPDSTVLASADSLIPDNLARSISLSVGLIPGVESTAIRCGIIDIEEDIK